MIERMMGDTDNAIGNCNACQTTAIRERIITDAGKLAVFAKRDARKFRTIRERKTVDIGHAIGYRDTLKACATRERAIADACHAIGNDNIR